MFDFYEEYQSDSIKYRLEANQKRIDEAKLKVQTKTDSQHELLKKSNVASSDFAPIFPTSDNNAPFEKFTIDQIKQQHKALLKKSGFLSEKNVSDLTEEEYETLNEKGFWLNALGRQEIAAFTVTQRHFVSVFHGKEKAESIFERAWVKYQRYIREISKKKRIYDLEKRKEKSRIIIKNSIMMGEDHYLKIRDQELKDGYITEGEADQIFQKYCKFMPNEDMTKKIGSTDGIPTTGGHDPYR